MSVIVLILSLIAPGFAFSEIHSFAPENKLNVPISDDAELERATHNEVTQAIAAVQSAYAPVVARYGARLIIHDKWNDGTVNAYAYRNTYGLWEVDIMGGLMRFGRMNRASAVGVICHEVGHHLGGNPRYSGNWASVEGQSDYWAFQRCVQRAAPGYVTSAMLNLSHVLATMSGSRIPSLSTPDRTVVPETLQSHPNAQCRLDTMYAAAKNRARPRCWFAY